MSLVFCNILSKEHRPWIQLCSSCRQMLVHICKPKICIYHPPAVEKLWGCVWRLMANLSRFSKFTETLLTLVLQIVKPSQCLASYQPFVCQYILYCSTHVYKVLYCIEKLILSFSVSILGIMQGS